MGSNADVSVANYPYPYTKESRFAQLDNGNNLGTQLATNLCFCMCFVSSFYVLFIIKERESRFKLLQFVGGVNVWTFWVSQLLWDFVTYTLTSIIIIATLACFQEDGFSSFDELGKLKLYFFGDFILY